MTGPVLAIEQSGSCCRAVVFSSDRRLLAASREELKPTKSSAGLVEFDPEEIWSTTVATSQAALLQARVEPGAVAAIGIAGDPTTTPLWDRGSGAPVHNAIAAADLRTEEQCRALRRADIEPVIQGRTGLRLHAGGTATKLAWMLDNIEGARTLAEQGSLAFGGVASFLLWRLTDGRVHATDATNAASTLLFNLTEQDWDETLLDIFSIPAAILPEIFDSATYFGAVDAEHFGGAGPVAVQGMAATGQAALLGQAGLAAGALSLSLSSGCSALLSTGRQRPASGDRDQVSIACRLDGKASFAKIAGNTAAADAYSWAQRTFGLSDGPREADQLVGSASPETEMYLVPADVTAGFPWFQGSTAGLAYGFQTDVTSADLVRASMESFVFATNDLLAAMNKNAAADVPTSPARVSGGLARSDRTMQFLADILDRPVERPTIVEAVALGVAWLAGNGADIWPDSESFIAGLSMDRRFEPRMAQSRRRAKINGWRNAVGLALAGKSAAGR